MKTIKTIELAGNNLLEAMKLALRTSFDTHVAKVAAMTDEEVSSYLQDHPELEIQDEALESFDQLREVIQYDHEPMLAGDEDLVEALESDLWPLCEHLLTRYDIELSPRVNVATNRKLWLADPDNLRIEGPSPRDAILRYYVTLKLGAEVTLP